MQHVIVFWRSLRPVSDQIRLLLVHLRIVLTHITPDHIAVRFMQSHFTCHAYDSGDCLICVPVKAAASAQVASRPTHVVPFKC